MIDTFGILDQLFQGKYIDKTEYLLCLPELHKHNGQEIRVPKDELITRQARLR